MSILNKIGLAFFVGVLLVPASVSGVTGSAGQTNVTGATNALESTSALATQIQDLLSKIQNLQSELARLKQRDTELRTELKAVVLEFRNRLKEGTKNEEVRLLQEILATDSNIYPEGVISGYFGPLTKKAVRRFQERHGIEGVGEVGPQTQKVLNAFLKKDLDKSHKISKNLLKKFERDDGTATSTDNQGKKPGLALGTEKVVICHTTGSSGHGETLKIAKPALMAHINHGDTLGECGDDDDDNVTDTTAPVISNMTTNRATTTAVIAWMTNEFSTTRVLYATSTPVVSASGRVFLKNSTLVTNHAINLSGLSANTTYHFVVSSTDASGNTATSTGHQFTTY